MRFIIGSSFFYNYRDPFKVELVRLWHQNSSNLGACRIVTLYDGNSMPQPGFNVEQMRLTGDLGHIGSHINNSKPHHLTGWSAAMTALAMIAYIDEADFIYKESDCLAFGPWVDRLYQDCEGAEFVYGPRMTSAPWMSCAQSLFLVKHHFIPAFVSTYLSMPSDRDMLGEDKFPQVEARYPHLTRRLSFGVDRMRPIPWNDHVFYFQQPTPEEIEEARNRRLI